jgi:hypothetical protein
LQRTTDPLLDGDSAWLHDAAEVTLALDH